MAVFEAWQDLPRKERTRNKLQALWYILRGHGVIYRTRYTKDGAMLLNPGHKVLVAENEYGL